MRAWVMLLVVSFAGVTQAAPLDEAKRHFYRGVALAQKTRFAEALDEFEASYRLNAVPEVLINVALCDRALGRYAEAIEHLERYLADASAGSKERHGEVTGILSELRRKVASASPPQPEPTTPPATTPEPVTTPPPPVAPPPVIAAPPSPAVATRPTAPPPTTPTTTAFLRSARGRAAVGIGAAALALFAASAVTGGVVLSERDRYRKSCDTSCDDPLYNHAHALALATDVLLAIGGAAAITSVVLALTRHPARRFASAPFGAGVTF